MYFDDINNCEKEEYRELTQGLKSHLLSRPFTQRDGDSLNIQVIAHYLDDYDIAMKAAVLPTKRLNKILDTYLTNCYVRFEECYKATLRTYDSKVHKDAVMLAATMGYVVEFLQEAINKNIPHPSHTKTIEKRNDALRILYETSRELSLEEELPEAMMSFDAFFKGSENECLSYIEELTSFKFSSEDRTRRILSDTKNTSVTLYAQLCDNPDLVEDKMDGYRSKIITLATNVIGNNSRCKIQFDAAKNNIMFILNKHDELTKNNHS